jgi:tetratricopeptide (TPR) repeat protein
MLGEADRSLFACLSVFVGGARLEAIEQVCGGEETADVLDTLASLVEKSLVRQSEGIGAEPRFGMLETIREFAMEQAIEHGRWDGMRARHAELFTAFAEASAERVMGSTKRETLDRLEQDHDNLRAAIGWAIETGAAETAMRLGSALWRFWQMRGYLQEGLERLEQILAVERSHEFPERRADALSAAAGLAYWLADPDRPRAYYDEEIAARRALGDTHGLAEALYGVSFTWSIRGPLQAENVEQALAVINEALELFREVGDDAGVAKCEWALANVAWGAGQLDDARRHGMEALAIFEAIDDRFMVGWTTYTLGLADLSEDLEGGGLPERRAEADRWFRRALEIFAEAQDISGYTLVLDAIASIALRSGDRERAARLSGAVANLERISGTGLNLWNREAIHFDPSGLKADPALGDAWAAGEAMSAADAVAYALGGTEAGPVGMDSVS